MIPPMPSAYPVHRVRSRRTVEGHADHHRCRTLPDPSTCPLSARPAARADDKAQTSRASTWHRWRSGWLLPQINAALNHSVRLRWTRGFLFLISRGDRRRCRTWLRSSLCSAICRWMWILPLCMSPGSPLRPLRTRPVARPGSRAGLSPGPMSMSRADERNCPLSAMSGSNNGRNRADASISRCFRNLVCRWLGPSPSGRPARHLSCG